MSRWPTLFLLALSGCITGTIDPGTAVGNPPDALVRIGPTDAVEVSAAALVDTVLTLAPCDLAKPVVEYPLGDLDLLTASPSKVLGMELCGVRFKADQLDLTVAVDDGDPQTLQFESIEIDMGPDDAGDPPTLAEAEHYILEIGGPEWLADLIAPLEGGDTINKDSTAYLAAESLLETESALWRDTDGDGSVGTTERGVPTMDAGQPPVREADDD